ncbi:hypothetical protein [Chryseobacterium vrystaatense]|uniref:Phage major capsid protein, HK97 family n=1 Tax=Chryseobacterium vrystaatense TaxID=307480 RepID=A0A1M4ZKW7_9FLAO|nr:hypothetical protein [Chryseobacterium vrystaatense]SHF18462.1 hypothetical protein SAMN02787073_1624 [Chryseobacterium vrystaatense]
MNLDATMWLDFQDVNSTNEKRFAELGVLDLAKDSTQYTDYISPTARKKMNESSSLRNVQIPVIKDQQVQVTSTPGFVIPANQEESAQYAFVAYDVFSGFRHTPALYGNNVIDSEYAVREKMKNISYAMGQRIESILATVLEARKTQALEFTTQVSQGDGTFNFNATTDTLEVNKAAQKETMFFNFDALMKANEVGGQYNFVTSRAGLAIQKAQMAKYGNANEKNLEALGLPNAERLYESGTIIPGSNIFNGFAVRDGAIGIVENFPFDFREGTEFAGKKWSISDIELPFTRMRANIYVNNEATNATALVGSGIDSNMIMTAFQEMAMWQRFYVVYRYNSDLSTRVNDIVKISGLTS